MSGPVFKRGDVWLVNLDPVMGAEINKTRPAVIISNDINNQYSSTLTILPISDLGEKVYPFEIQISHAEMVRCQQIRTIDKLRLVKRIGLLSSEKMLEIGGALMIHLAIEN